MEGYARTAAQLDQLIAEGLPMILKRIGVAMPTKDEGPKTQAT
jgi:hypothetical protein